MNLIFAAENFFMTSQGKFILIKDNVSKLFRKKHICDTQIE